MQSEISGNATSDRPPYSVEKLAEKSRLSAAEIEWTRNRLRELIAGGYSIDAAVATITAESAREPWRPAG